MRSLRKETADRLLNIVLKSNTLEEEEFFRLANVTILNYTLEIVNAINEGFEGEPDSTQKKMDTNSTEKTQVAWSFSGAFLYSLTVITTIGGWSKRKENEM